MQLPVGVAMLAFGMKKKAKAVVGGPVRNGWDYWRDNICCVVGRNSTTSDT